MNDRATKKKIELVLQSLAPIGSRPLDPETIQWLVYFINIDATHVRLMLWKFDLYGPICCWNSSIDKAIHRQLL